MLQRPVLREEVSARLLKQRWPETYMAEPHGIRKPSLARTGRHAGTGRCIAGQGRGLPNVLPQRNSGPATVLPISHLKQPVKSIWVFHS